MEAAGTPAIDGWFTTVGGAPRLLGQRCTGWGTTVFPPSATTCPNPGCRSDELDGVELARTGTVWSWATNHYAPPAPYVAPDPFVPYTVVAVELDGEGLTVLGQLEPDVDPAGLSVGLPVEVTVSELFTDESGPRTMFRFRPVVEVTA